MKYLYALLCLVLITSCATPSITLSIYSHVVKGMEIDVNNYIPNIALKQVK